MLHCVSDRKPEARPKKESKRRYLNLKSNENLISDQSALARLQSHALDVDHYFRYPVYDEAYEALRDHLGVQHVLLTAGCHDAIRVIAGSLDPVRNRVLLTLPNYDGYRHYFAVNGIPVVRRYRTPSQRHELFSLKDQAVTERCNIVVLTNPDPFVGDSFTRAEIEAFVAACGAVGISVILDEVYAGFGRESDVCLTKVYSNLLVLSSLSKSYGMPGLRIGWIASASKTIDRLGCEFPESSIPSFSLSVMVSAFRNGAWVRDYRDTVVRNRESLSRELSRLESMAPYTSSVTNFLLFRATGSDARSGLWAAMLGRGIYLADLNGVPGFDGHFRATVCAAAEREKLLNGFECVRGQEDSGRRSAMQRQDDSGQEDVRAVGYSAL